MHHIDAIIGLKISKVFFTVFQNFHLPFPFPYAQLFSCVQPHATLWTVAHQAPLSMGLPRQDTVVDCHFLLQMIFLTQGLNPLLLHLLHWQADSLLLSYLWSPSFPIVNILLYFIIIFIFRGFSNFFHYEEHDIK